MNPGSEGSCTHTRSCIRVLMHVMGGGVKVNPNTEIENEEKIKKLTQKSHFSAWFNSSFDCHCELYNTSGFNPSNLCNSGISGVADERVLKYNFM